MITIHLLVEEESAEAETKEEDREKDHSYSGFFGTENIIKSAGSSNVWGTVTTKSGVEVIRDNFIQISVLRSKITKALEFAAQDCGKNPPNPLEIQSAQFQKDLLF